MMAARLHWSAAYVGIPWADRGRARDGCDCWGLVRLVYRDELGIRLPSYDGLYASAAEIADVAAVVAGAEAGWIRACHAGAYDVAVFRTGRFDSHVGVMVDPSRMLHLARGGQAVVEAIAAGAWGPRLTGIWRHRALAPEPVP